MEAWWTGIKEWQTLIAGTMAVVAAVWTIREIRRQVQVQSRAIEQQQAQHDEMQRRRELRAQVDLPDAVVEVMLFARQCFRAINADARQPIPHAPAHAMANIKCAIEFAHPSRVPAFRDLVNWYQIQNSRMRDDYDGGRQYEVELLVGCLELHTLAERLLEYGRAGEADWNHPACSFDDLYSALRRTVGLGHFLSNEGDYQEIVDHIRLFHPAPETNGQTRAAELPPGA